MFIVVKKVVREIIRNHISGEKMKGGYIVKQETIVLDNVKAAREWKMNKEEQMSDSIESMTVLYMEPSADSKDLYFEMQIAEHIDEFNRRIGAIPLKKSNES